MKYRLLAPAIADLKHIDDWVGANFGGAAALRATRKLSETFTLLATFQQLGMARLESPIAASAFSSCLPTGSSTNPEIHS
jgi:plasmid stabilization system protein ParE